jgi:leader peptidase (prepilin peptidase)/N-methyltransferase
VRITDVHDPVAAMVTAALAAGVGASFCPWLAKRGLNQLKATVDYRRLSLVGLLVGATAGVAAALVARHAGSWWLLPAALAWTLTLATGALCDAFTQRIPTAVVRQGAVITGALVIVASAAAARWHWALLAAVGAISSGLVLAFCWRYLGAGYGDVRIAIVGGLGLVHSTYVGIAAGIGTFALVTLIQAVAVLARGGDRRTLFPYGPAIAAAFVVAGMA